MMRTRRPGLATLAAAATLVLISACGQEAAPGDDPGSGGSTPSATTTAPTLPAPTAAPQSVVDQSIALLAEQLQVAPDQIEVVRSIEIDWNDGSIGCSKKGMGYIQVITPGSLVELAVDGTTYAFHAEQGKPPFYCAKPTEPKDEQ
jgi:hypothetical protein